MRSQALEIKKNLEYNELPIDMRPEWTQVSLGRDCSTTVCTIAGRILVTRTCGFMATRDAARYCTFIDKVIAEGLYPGLPHSYVMEWSELKGGSVGARKQVWNFVQALPYLHTLLICNASALMRMSVKITQRVTPSSHTIVFCPSLDQGIFIAGKRLGLSLPDYLELPSVFSAKKESSLSFGDQFTQLFDPSDTGGPVEFQYKLPNGHGIEFKKVGDNILFCHLNGHTKNKSISASDILKARRRAVATCLPGQSAHIEIWDCTNFDSLFTRAAIRRLIKTLFHDTLPLIGCFFLDIGCKIRTLVRWRLWLYRPAYPVHCLASLTMAILKAQEQLCAAGSATEPSPPKIETRPHWQYIEDDFYLKNEIIDHDIIHSFGRGYLRLQQLKQIYAIQRQMAFEIVSAGSSYYLMGGTGVLRGASYKARKRFLYETRRLYRDFPFRMYVFYGAKGKVRAAINLARHSVPYRMILVDDYDSALAIIRADKMRRAYLEMPESNEEQMVLPPAASAALQRGVDGIMRYLNTISWEHSSKIHPSPRIAPTHPFAQIYDAIDLINDDLKSIDQERRKAAREKNKLEQQLARSRKMEALGLLAGGIAHDLNNVLSPIVTYPEVLLMDLPEASELRNIVKSIRDSGKKAAAIVQDLLTMARRGVNTLEPLQLNSLIEDYLNSPEHKAICERYSGITVKTDLARDLKNIHASPVHMKQTIMNMVFNAIEASVYTGQVCIHTANRVVDMPINGYDTIPAGEYVTFQVKDHGNGIAKAAIERIFEPFYTTKKMGRSGTGLGMAVVWNAVRDSKGYFDIHSTMGQGTMFTLYFPVSDDTTPADSEEIRQEDWLGNGEAILIVDDKQQQRELATEILRRQGYQVSAVDSGEAVPGFLEHHNVDLVIVDMIMDPGIDGLETIRRIKQTNPNQKTIICTGFAEDERIKKAQVMCNGPLVKKPYSIQSISKAIFQALNG